MRAIFFDANGILYGRAAADEAATTPEARAAIVLFPGVPQTLATLRARGLLLGVITDSDATSDEKRRWLRDAGLDFAWDCFVNSRELGVRKPHPAICLAALARCGVRAADAIFVGHATHELRGARAVGLITIACHADPGADGDHAVARFADLPDLPPLRMVLPERSARDTR